MSCDLGTFDGFIEPNDALVIEFYEGNEIRFRLCGHQTNGAVEIFERIAPAKEVLADMHLHSDITEVMHVLEGEVEFTLGDKVTVLGVGGMCVVRPGIPHMMRNMTDERVRLLISFSPAGKHDQFFSQLRDAWPDLHGRSQELTDRLRREFGGFTCDSHGNPTDGL